MNQVNSNIAEVSRDIRTLQLGVNWLPEVGGNGLDRVYYELIRCLPDVGVRASGLVLGTKAVAESTGGSVRAVARTADPLHFRMRAIRAAASSGSYMSQFDLVASHFALSTYPLLSRLGERPLVVHFHGPWSLESRVEGESSLRVGLKKLIEKKVYRRGQAFIVLSAAFRKILVQHYGVAEDCIHVVPGGVNTRRFKGGKTRAEARTLLGWPVDRPIVLSVRRLANRMGLEDLIRAMRLVLEKAPDTLLVVAGRGPLRPHLEALVDATGLRRHVRLTGFLPDAQLPTAYRAADVSVVPSVALEGFGLVAAESLGAGTPVIVRPVGGLPEVVRGLSENLVVADMSTESLGAHVGDVLTGHIAVPTADECQAYASDRFDWSAVARQVRNIYEQAIQ